MNYSPTQIKLIRIFGKKELTDGCRIEILWHIPELHDVYRVANDIDLAIHANLDSKLVSELKAYRNSKEWIVKIPYNPTLSLLSQTDDIKESIINLFS